MNFYDRAAEYVKKWEGFSEKAVWDVNAWRLGHGSDTLTLSDGTYRKVLQTDTTTKELAAKDLARRIRLEFEPKVEKKIGKEYYDKLTDSAKIALISIAYNYGNITTHDIVDAARTGDVDKLAFAIVNSTKNDNAGTAYYNGLRRRRKDEAEFAKLDKRNIVKLSGNKNAKIIIISILLIVIAILLIIFRKQIVSKITKL
jgi:GH24 family phage-related lysozyme (muramidase)